MNVKRSWHTHTGSAPGCQDTPQAQIKRWFGGDPVRVRDARDCFVQMCELEEEDEDEHRCFSRREYSLDLDDVREIIRGLKREARTD